MAQSSIPFPAPEAKGDWPQSVTPTIASNDGESPEGRVQKPSSIRDQPEAIAATIRNFLKLRGVADQDGTNLVFNQLCAEGAGTGV